ncbi:hypothetical protein OH685_09130 [Acinetobacter pittii]|nr:hypothetical protein OH685_09130 [Acinetobacter pittii]
MDFRLNYRKCDFYNSMGITRGTIHTCFGEPQFLTSGKVGKYYY